MADQDQPVIDVGGPAPLGVTPDPLASQSPASAQGGQALVAPRTISADQLPPPALVSRTINPDALPPPPGAASATTDNITKYGSLVDAAAQKYGVPADVARAVVHTESGWDPNAKSSAGALGLTQLEPGTAKDMGVDPKDPAQNIDGGMKYLGGLITQFHGNVPLALAAYNQGPNAGSALGSPSAMRYIQKVYDAMGQEVPESATPMAHTAQALKYGPGFQFSQGATLGAAIPVTAALRANFGEPGDSTQQEMDVLNSARRGYLSDSPVEGTLATMAGAVTPMAAAGRGVMLGGTALSKAFPYLAGALSSATGAAGAYAPVASGASAVARGAVSGAGYGALGAGIDPDSSMANQMATGAVAGGALGLGGQLVRGVWNYTGAPIYNRLFSTPAGFQREAQQKLGRVLGPGNVPAEQAASAIPGVERTLPEALGGTNPQVSQQLQNSAAADPLALSERIEANNEARVNAYHQITGTPADVAKVQAQKDLLNTQINPILHNPKAPDIDLNPALAMVDHALASPNTKMESFRGTMQAIRNSLFKKEAPGPAGQSTMDLNSLKAGLAPKDIHDLIEQQLSEGSEEKPKQLETRPEWVNGVRKSLQELLDKHDKGESHLDKALRDQVVQLKNHLTEQLKDNVPGYRVYSDAYQSLAERQKELEFLQSKKAENTSGALSPSVLKGMIRDIEQSPYYRGVLGAKNKAKSVSQKTVEGLRGLVDDMQVSHRAGIPINTPDIHAEHSPGFAHSILHYLGGAAGVAAAESTHGKIPGAVGWLAGAAAQRSLERIATLNKLARDKAMLHVLLHPTTHPPLAPKAPSIPPGFYSGMLGASGGNTFLQQGQTGAVAPRDY